MEHPSAINNRLKEAKAALEDLKKEIERNRRLKGAELAKIEPNSHRIEGYESTIKEMEERIESVPYQIEALEERLEEAKRLEEGKIRVAARAADLIPRLQKLTKHLSLLMKETDGINSEILEINTKIANLERGAGIKISRPLCSLGYQSIESITASVESEANGSGRTLFFWPGRDWPA